MWDGFKIVHDKPRHSQSQGSIERANQDVQNMFVTWMADRNCNRWSEGLRFVQLMENRAYHDGIQHPPYQAIFGCDIKVGLALSCLPEDVIDGLETEEDLGKVISETRKKSIEISDDDDNYQEEPDSGRN